MNEVELCAALVRLVEKAVSNILLLDKTGDPRQIKVFNGYLPLKGNEEEDFPYVLVRFEKSSTDWEGTESQIAIIAGTYCEGKDAEGTVGNKMQGFIDGLNILSMIRSEILTLPNGVMEERFVVKSPIVLSDPGEQEFPYWHCEMTTSWVLPFISMNNIRAEGI